MEPPPPPPTTRAPPALAEELVEEILLRCPPDDPARLVRAALVCKRWCRLVSGSAFRRRRLRHCRPAPMLGFLCNDVSRASAGGGDACSARFVRTAPSCPPVGTRRGWRALDARAGRVLLHRAAAAAAPAQEILLAVWDPLAAGDNNNRHHLDLPAPALPRLPRSWNAALLCGDRLDADAPFRVVLVGTDSQGIFASVYSSSDPAAAWSEPAYAPQQPGADGGGDHVDAVRGALVGDALYFVFQRRTRVLRYDVGTRAMSVVHLPPAPHNQRIALTTTEAGGLGFARMEGYRLGLWSMEETTEQWTRGRVIDLRTLLPVIDLLGFAHGLGVLLVGTVDGFFSVAEKSGRIDKVGDGPGFYNLVPYVSSYTPALGTMRDQVQMHEE